MQEFHNRHYYYWDTGKIYKQRLLCFALDKSLFSWIIHLPHTGGTYCTCCLARNYIEKASKFFFKNFPACLRYLYPLSGVSPRDSRHISYHVHIGITGAFFCQDSLRVCVLIAPQIENAPENLKIFNIWSSNSNLSLLFSISWESLFNNKAKDSSMQLLRRALLRKTDGKIISLLPACHNATQLTVP